METLPKPATNTMPLLTVWVACDWLVWSSLDVVWEGKPIVAAFNKVIRRRYEMKERD
jgi:hypothetical protein